jgi:hypothetical protein
MKRPTSADYVWEETMSFAASNRVRHLEYFLLHDAKPTGPSVGIYANRDIPASVVDDFGRRYLFSGIAPRQGNGQFDLDALRAGEFILKPGLVYRMEHLPRNWIESLFR